MPEQIMMIEVRPCHVVDGKPYATLHEAQSAALAATLGDGIGSTQEAVSRVLASSTAVRTILGVEAPPEPVVRRRKPRKDAGVPRKPRGAADHQRNRDGSDV
jgi:hypothetical protein